MADESKSNVFKQIILKGPKNILEQSFFRGLKLKAIFTHKNLDFLLKLPRFWGKLEQKVGQPYFFILSLSLSEMFSDSRIHFTFATSASELTPFFHFDFSVSVNFKVLSVFLN